MQKYSLHELAKVESGKSFRQKPDFITSNGCYLIQMKDVSPNGFEQTPQSISLNEVNENQLLQPGDLIFLAKGNNNYAVVYDSNQPATAVSVFFMIRPDINRVNSEYLTWYLNSPKSQAYFHEQRLGASVGNIRKEALENLEIELPSMEKQKQITKLNNLLREEMKLTHEYIEKKELYLNQIMLNLIEN